MNIENRSYLAVGEEQTDALHANLQQTSLTSLHVLYRKFSAQLAWCTHATSCASPFQGIFDAVVKVFALKFEFVHWQFRCSSSFTVISDASSRKLSLSKV